MRGHMFDRSATVGVACLYILSSQVPSTLALSIDINDPVSIKEASSQIAYGMMKYYTGNRTGDVPGNLPDPYYWWEAGAMFGGMVDYWYYTGDTTYNEEVMQAMQHQVGTDKDYMPANQSKSLGNDDQLFWAFAAMTAAELNFTNPPAGNPSWLALAQAVFNEQALRWDDTSCGGGLRWQIFVLNNGWDYKNTISNGGFFQLAARLGRYTGNSTYTDWATKTWNWFEKSALFELDTWQINDGADSTTNCSSSIDKLQWTYNYGTWLVGMAHMYNHTNDTVWYTRLDSILNVTLDTFFPTSTTGDPIMVEIVCEPYSHCNNDQRTFKAFLSRWLAITAQLVPQQYERIFSYLRMSAKAAAAQCSGGTDGITCGQHWSSTTWDGMYGVGEQMCALAIVNTMLIDTEDLAPPYTNISGGTSVGDPTAGSGDSSNLGGSLTDSVARSKITTADKAAAGIVTAVLLIAILGGAFWLISVD